MRKFLVSLLVALTIMAALSALPGEVIPFGASFYDEADMLFILNGQTIPSASRPWTIAEAENELAKIDESSLDGYTRNLYEKLLAYVRRDYKASLSLNVSLSPEVYAHTNQDFNTDDYWVYNYERRKPIGILSLDAAVGGYYANTELSYGLGRATNSDKTKYYTALDSFPVDMTTRKYVVSSNAYSPFFRFNYPKSGEVDVITPTNAMLTYAWENGSIGYYKSKKEWGKTSIGNYIYDSHISAYNFISAKFFNKKFSFDYTVMFPYSYLGGSAKAYSIEYQRLFLSHRLQIQILKNLSIAMSENLMYWLKDGFEPIFVNPALFFHNNIQDNLFNALAHVELEYVPVKGLRIYSQIGVDQGSMPFVEKIGTEDLSAGFTIGTEYLFKLYDGIAGVNLEGAMVTPSMYRRSTNPDFIISDPSSIDMPGDYYTLPFITAMGFPYGGDTLAVRAECNYRTSRFSGSLSTTLLWKGEQTIFKKKGGISGLELTGNITFGTAVEVSAEYILDLIKNYPISLKASIAGLYNQSRGFDLQVSVGASISAAGRLLEK